MQAAIGYLRVSTRDQCRTPLEPLSTLHSQDSEGLPVASPRAPASARAAGNS
jgi:hypothetical protein